MWAFQIRAGWDCFCGNIQVADTKQGEIWGCISPWDSAKQHLLQSWIGSRKPTATATGYTCKFYTLVNLIWTSIFILSLSGPASSLRNAYCIIIMLLNAVRLQCFTLYGCPGYGTQIANTTKFHIGLCVCNMQYFSKFLILRTIMLSYMLAPKYGTRFIHISQLFVSFPSDWRLFIKFKMVHIVKYCGVVISSFVYFREQLRRHKAVGKLSFDGDEKVWCFFLLWIRAHMVPNMCW